MCSGTALLCLLLLAAPWLVRVLAGAADLHLIYAIVGLGLMLLAGFTGQFSIGHAAFLGVGAYTQAVLTGMGWPFPLALACGGAVGAVGVVVGCRRCASRASTWALPRCRSASSSKRSLRAGKA
jgi:branched-chain amino acid transport system permease protein